MLPPIPLSVLDQNPRFHQLYKDISTSRLNPDASSRLIKQQRAQTEVEKQLLVVRKESLQKDLLQDALYSIANQLQSLPLEVRTSCLIVAGQLRGGLSATEMAMLKDVLDDFTKNASAIAAAISKELQQQATRIAALLASDDGRDAPPPDAAQLAANAAKVLAQNGAAAQKIAQLRARVTDLSNQIAAVHREILEASVRILEQTLHGSVARGLRAKAEHFAVVAKGLDLKIKILDVSDPLRSNSDLRDALEFYGEHLGDEKRRYETKLREMQNEVEGYEREKGMAEIGKRFAELLVKGNDVKAEIARLQAQEDPAGGVD